MDNKIVTCPREEDHERRIHRLEERYDELKEHFYESDKHFEVMYTEISGSLKALAGLPEAMSTMTNTMVSMQDAIQDNGDKTTSLAGTVNKLSAKVEEMDSRDKISILKIFKDNWLAIAALLGCALLLGKDLISSMFS